MMDRKDQGPYRAEAVQAQGQTCDIAVHMGGKIRHMWGRKGLERERALAGSVGQGRLPVLLGSGLGQALEELAGRFGRVAVVDREEPVQAATGARELAESLGNVLWLDDPDPEAVRTAIETWRAEAGGGEIAVAAMPFYLSLRPEYYGLLAKTLTGRGPVAKARLGLAKPRVLLFRRTYFLYPEIEAALERLGVPCKSLDVEESQAVGERFPKALAEAAREFRPNLVLTVNHMGLDREGVLTGLLERLGLPLASWFVDNPHLVLYRYSNLAAKNLAVFTWDEDTVDSLRALGFGQAHYLPLGTDPHRFRPDAPPPSIPLPPARAAFVGDSMKSKVDERLAQSDPGPELAKAYPEIARDFAASPEPSPARFMQAAYPALYEHFNALPGLERRLAFEILLTWEATRQYRQACVRALLPAAPLIAGDQGWAAALAGLSGHTLVPRLGYYVDLPGLYARTDLNFNCTSRQMKGAVNQRVFDAPACGAFLLTDAQPQLFDLFEPDKECAIFNDPEEIPDLARHWLNNAPARQAVALAARKRTLAEHTYDQRLKSLLRTMRQDFG